MGQRIYTPVNGGDEPLPGERPYAGWLYARAGFADVTRHSRRSLSAVAGVTGPPSLGRKTQELFHHMVRGFREPLGWDHQLPAELDAGISASQRWTTAASSVMALEPFATIDLGTIRTAATAGATAKLGWHVGHPWLAASAHAFEVYLFAGGEASAVARDLFLDGTTYRGSERIQHKPTVVQWDRGLHIRIRRLFVEYRVVTTGIEYEGQQQAHPYGGISFGWY